MTNSEQMMAECLDEIEEVLRSWQHRRIASRTHAWASTLNRAFKMDGRVITMHLTVDVTAPPDEPVSPDVA